MVNNIDNEKSLTELKKMLELIFAKFVCHILS